jgi:alpha-ribazole phosphatase
MQLYLIRHPQPLVGPGICYGRTDLAVNLAEQARIVNALRPVLPTDAVLWSSPLQRCAGLAQDLATALGCAAPRYDPRLAELDFGAWEMRAWDTIARAEVDRWASDVSTYRPGGGESVLQMAQRVHAFHADLLEVGAERVIVVCHGGTIRLLQACLKGMVPAAMASEAAKAAATIPFGSVTRIHG